MNLIGAEGLVMEAVIKTCYMCTEVATSGEHAPPRCFFPETKYIGEENNQRINLIKVPSCDLHNSQKSTDDEYLLYLFSMSKRANGCGMVNLHTKVVKSARRRPKLAEKIFKNEKIIDEKNVFEIDRERIDKAMGQMARAIFHYETGLKWFAPVHINSTIFEIPEEQDGMKINRNEVVSAVWSFVAQSFSLLKDRPWKGGNQRSFKYKILYEDNEFLLMNFMFYENIDFQIISHPNLWALELGV